MKQSVLVKKFKKLGYRVSTEVKSPVYMCMLTKDVTSEVSQNIHIVDNKIRPVVKVYSDVPEEEIRDIIEVAKKNLEEDFKEVFGDAQNEVLC